MEFKHAIDMLIANHEATARDEVKESGFARIAETREQYNLAVLLRMVRNLATGSELRFRLAEGRAREISDLKLRLSEYEPKPQRMGGGIPESCWPKGSDGSPEDYAAALEELSWREERSRTLDDEEAYSARRRMSGDF